METFSLSGVTAIPIIDTRRAKATPNDDANKPKEVFYPVKYRVTFMRKQVYYSSGIDLTLSEWEIMPDTRKKGLIEQRELIQLGFDRIKNYIKDLIKGEGFTIEALNKRLSRGMKNSIITAFNNKIDSLTKAGRIGSSIMYGCTLKSIETYSKKDLKYSEITVDWLKGYEKYMIDLGRSYSTVGMYMRTLRAIINEGKSQGIISNAQYMFGEGKYEIPTGVGRKMALTLSQIGEVLKYPLVIDKDRMCRDLWFFSYLCNGINIADLLRLKYSNIHIGEIRFYRQKTIKTANIKKDIAAILLPELRQIIDKWGNPDRKPDNYIFPFLQDALTPTEEKRIIQNVTRMINERMQRIGKALDYGNISTYTARHSFATVLKRSGANIAFISESLGHSDLKTTENYLDSFEKEEREKNAVLLTKFE
jgi:integrase/recombinase XerD